MSRQEIYKIMSETDLIVEEKRLTSTIKVLEASLEELRREKESRADVLHGDRIEKDS